MNKDNYKKAIDQIHASDELKQKTLENMKQRKMKKVSYIKYLSVAAVIVLVFGIGLNTLEKKTTETPEIPIASSQKKENKVTEIELPRFKNIEELKEVLAEKNEMYSRTTNGIFLAESAVNQEAVDSSNVKSDSVNDLSSTAKQKDFSTTNIQVENVDEADIVKTDGDYIYYVTSEKVYIIEAKELKIVSKIEVEENNNKSFYPNEIFINKDKLILLGSLYEQEKEQNKISGEAEDGVYYDYARAVGRNTAVAMVYDISNRENPELKRQVGLDGNYINSRMIGENVYFISSKYTYYYDEIKENEILPRVMDSVSEEYKTIACTDIAYFRDTNSYNFMLVGGFNINNNDEMSVETFFGASEDVYASENNLYITQTKYDKYYESKTIIYKFNLDNSNIKLVAQGEVEGYLNNQFSMDEYDGNLRIATTYYINKNTMVNVLKEVITDSYVEPEYSNRLYVLDENLNEIGRIDDLAIGEKIYSVRFMGKMGYIVTFEQIDPLFVIDLSDPTKPEIKGELKIPGYSAYLHPYDETHIIGIGYNTKSNGYGGITTDNMKMSMFDVSDLENPKELFNIDIGESYTYSDILNNHKVLFYKKADNLIGFPVNYNEKSEIAIYKIDLESGFEEYLQIRNKERYSYADRIIYIEDVLYILDSSSIVSYDLKSFEKINELELDEEKNINFPIVAY